MLGFKLIKDKTFYKRVDTITGGDLVGGIYTEVNVDTNYLPFAGRKQPYKVKGQVSTVLPDGVNSSDVQTLYTSEILNTHISSTNNATIADIIYFEDPSSGGIDGYVVFNKKIWDGSDTFKLLGDYTEYTCIRETKKELL